MISVKGMHCVHMLQVIREISGKADFIAIMLHDGEIKLNDPGDLAIPSRTVKLKALDLNQSDLKLLNDITNFVCEIETPKIGGVK